MHKLLHLILSIGLAVFVFSVCQPVAYTPQVLATIKLPEFEDGIGTIVSANHTGYTYVTGLEHVALFKNTKLVTVLPTGGRIPWGMAVDENAGLVYVANHDSDNVAVIRGTKVIGLVSTSGRVVSHVAVEPQSQWVYLISGYRRGGPYGRIQEGSLVAIRDIHQIGILNLGMLFPLLIVAEPVTGLVYVCGEQPLQSEYSEVRVFKGLQEISRIRSIKGRCVSMDVDSKTSDVYVLSTWCLYRLREGKMIESVELPRLNPVWEMHVHPLTGDIYILWDDEQTTEQNQYRGRDHYRGPKRMLVLRKMKEIGNIPVGKMAYHFAIDPVAGNIYVANAGEGTVTVIKDIEVIKTIGVGAEPLYIGIDSSSGGAYIFHPSGTVTIIGYN